MSNISIENVSFFYRDAGQTTLALDDISLQIDDGQFVCLIGHSGCGKSTLLSLLAGLEIPEIGTITIDHKPVTSPSIDRAMVFQHYSLFPWMRVAKNVEFSIQHSKAKSANAKEIALKCLKDVGMEDSANKYPFQLSGGMQQRVAIARALAMESDILLLDEPFGALDARNRAELQQLLLKLWHDETHRRTVIFVTHDISEAILLADKVVFMQPGKIQKVIDVSFTRPRDINTLQYEPEFRKLHDELMNLFYMDDNNRNDVDRLTYKNGSPESPVDAFDRDDAEGILHYSDIQGGD